MYLYVNFVMSLYSDCGFRCSERAWVLREMRVLTAVLTKGVSGAGNVLSFKAEDPCMEKSDSLEALKVVRAA